MTTPYEGDPTDLFDFPEVPGMEEFGLVPPVRKDVDLTEYEEDAAAPAPAQAEAPAAPAGDAPAAQEARANPPVPEGVSDLDEDLFSFDEIFSLDEDPYYNGTLTAEGMPANDVFIPDGENAEPGTPSVTVESAQPEQKAVGRPPQPDLDSEPDRSAVIEPGETTWAGADAQQPVAAAAAAAPDRAPAQPAAAVRPAAPAPAPREMDLMAGAAASTAPLDRGPRILLPEDVPYGVAPGRETRLIWALIACFLIVNTGIFWLTHLASTNVNQSISQATGVIAGALAQSGNNQVPVYLPAPTQQGYPMLGAAPPDLPDGVEHTVESVPAPEADNIDADPVATETVGAPTPQPRPEPEPWIAATDYKGTHEFAVGYAKKLLADGRFEDARRLLNHVLANQSRVPLAPTLRQEIDYLIPLTYFEQGRATAAQGDQL